MNPQYSTNLSRQEAREFEPSERGRDIAWISIGEVYEDFHHIQNRHLDKCKKLKISFHDVKVLNDKTSGPSLSLAKRIVRFCLNNKEKDFIVNCALGVSRSAAICRFLEDELNIKWDRNPNIENSYNTLLYKYLVLAHKQYENN